MEIKKQKVMRNKVEKLSIAFALAFTITSCGSDDDNPSSENHKPVASEVSITEADLTVGQELTATAKGDDEDGDDVTFTYKWYRSADNELQKEGDDKDTAIDGATESTYTLQEDDVDNFIIVEVTPNDDEDNGKPVPAVTSDKVKAAKVEEPTATIKSDTDGTFKEGVDLSVDITGFTDEQKKKLTYQWSTATDDKGAGAADISTGGTGATYTPASGDVGKYISVKVTLPKEGETEAKTITAAYVGPFVAANQPPTVSKPTITGTKTVGETLTASATDSDDDGDTVTLKYKWYQADDNSGTNEKAISGENASTYELKSADENKYITVGVTPNDGTVDGTEVKADYYGPISN